MKNKGISLIVLVITIVVIIILAAAVILSLSQNNPISNAKEARDKSNIATEKEAIQVAIMNLMLKNDIGNLEINETNLNSVLSDIAESIIEDEDHFDVTTKTGNEYIIKLDGNVLSLEELYEEMEKNANVVISKIERADDVNRIYFYYRVYLYNDKYSMNSCGLLLNRQNNFEGELTTENMEMNYILEYGDGAMRTKDINGAVHVRFWVEIKYGNHTHIKYCDTIHTSWAELGE